MINLLPPELKQEYHYARENIGLLRWVISFVFGIVGLVMLCGVGWFYLQQQADTHLAQARQAQQELDQQNQAVVEKDAKAMSGSLKLAFQVLSKEILFSEMLTQLATTIPNNAVLSGLSISQITGAAVDITASTTDYTAATQLQVNLTDPANKIFEKADIVSISCAATAPNNKYPCTVMVRAQFAKDNPFLFINNKPGV